MTDSKATRRNSLLLIFFAGLPLLIFFRETAYFSEPRIWAEEGSVFIQSVLDEGVLRSLFLPHVGYYSLFANFIAASSLKLFGLEEVAYGTTAASLILMSLIVVAPFILSSRFWKSPVQQMLLSLFSILVSSGEIWLTTINVQWFLGLFACYLLLSEEDELVGFRRVYAVTLLSIGALTGVTSIALTPFYLLKAYLNREHSQGVGFRNRILFLLILCLGIVVQLGAAVYLARTSHELSRLNWAHLSHWPLSILRTGAYIFRPPEEFRLLRYMAGALVPVFLFLLWKSLRRKYEIRPILGISIFLTALFTLLSFQMSGAPRYGYASSMMLILWLVYLTRDEDRTLRRTAQVLLTGVLVLLVPQYFENKRFYDHRWITYSAAYKQSETNGGVIRLFPQWENTAWVIERRDRK